MSTEKPRYVAGKMRRITASGKRTFTTGIFDTHTGRMAFWSNILRSVISDEQHHKKLNLAAAEMNSGCRDPDKFTWTEEPSGCLIPLGLEVPNGDK